MFNNKNNNNVYKNSVDYKYALNDEQINAIGLASRDFRKGKISYQELVTKLESLGFKLCPILAERKDFTTMKQLEAFKKRTQDLNFIGSDIRSYLLTNDKQEKIIFRDDRCALEVMAKFGDEESAKDLEKIERFEKKYRSSSHQVK